MSTLKSVFDEQKLWCDRIGSRNCRSTRDLSKDKCKICSYDYFKAQVGMEQFGVDPSEEAAQRPIISIGPGHGGPGPMDELLASIESGRAKACIPVNTRLLIDGTMWLVVDHDHVQCDHRQHTMTIRSIPTEYPAFDFADKESPTKGFCWGSSHMRGFLNEVIFPKLPAALRGAALPVNLYSLTFQEACAKCGSVTCTCTCHGRVLKPFLTGTTDKVWIPSINQCLSPSVQANIVQDEVILDVINDENPLLDLYDNTKFQTNNLSIEDKDGNNITWWLRSMWMEPGEITEVDNHKRGMIVESLDDGYNITSCEDPNALWYLVPHITL